MQAFAGLARVIVLAPIEPAATGNGLAMRTSLFCRAVPPDVELLLVVVPVAGQPDRAAPTERQLVIVRADPAAARAGVAGLLRDAVWRERLTAAGTLPWLARAASPGLADAVAQACGGGRVGLHVMRSYLAPLGTAVSERLDHAWFSLDLDDDDAALAARLGQPAEAAAYERMLAVFGPSFDGLSAASAGEAEAMSERYRLVIEHIPNAIDVRDRPARMEDHARARKSLLFVGNLTYEPNAEAARVLAQEILPRVRERLGGEIGARLVGHHHEELRRLAAADVELTGFVPDLTPVYAAADVVVAPLAVGSGTRVKLLEAFTHEVPVVASCAAADGLLVADREHLLLADEPGEAAAAIAEILSDLVLARRLTTNARQLVTCRYDTRLIVPEIREFFGRADARARSRRQPAAAS